VTIDEVDEVNCQNEARLSLGGTTDSLAGLLTFTEVSLTSKLGPLVRLPIHSIEAVVGVELVPVGHQTSIRLILKELVVKTIVELTTEQIPPREAPIVLGDNVPEKALDAVNLNL
jgi:hypothetical protein